MDTSRCSLLVVDDDPAVLTALTVNLAEEFEVTGPDGRMVIALRSREPDGNVALRDQGA